MSLPCKCDQFWEPSEYPCRFAPVGTTALCGNTARQPATPKADDSVLDYYSWGYGSDDNGDGYN